MLLFIYCTPMKEQKTPDYIIKANALCEKLRQINANSPFTKKKTLSLMDKKMIEMEDLKLSNLGYYDISYNNDLYSVAF